MSAPENWKWASLGDVVEINRAALTENCEPEKEFYYLDLGTIEDGRISFPDSRIKFREAPSRARRIVQRGDVLMATVRPQLGGHGYVDFAADDYICSTGFAVLHPKNTADGRFVFQTLFSPWVQEQFRWLTAGSNYPALNATQVAELEILLPPEPERKHIASILDCWDAAILKGESFRIQLCERKRGLMQQLLTGRKRFGRFQDQKWRKLLLGNVVSYEPRITLKPKEAFLAAGVRSHGKGVFLKLDFEAEDIALDELFQLRINDLVVNITFGWEGAVAIVPPEAEGALVSHRFPTFTFKPGVSFPGYFRHVIRQKRFVHEMGLASPGGAGRNRVLSKTGFLNIPVELPPFAVQQGIADVLNACDREIELLQKKLEALKEQKRGLMQKLLTGEIRLKSQKYE